MTRKIRWATSSDPEFRWLPKLRVVTSSDPDFYWLPRVRSVTSDPDLYWLPKFVQASPSDPDFYWLPKVVDTGGAVSPVPTANQFLWVRKGIGQTNSSGLTAWADQSGNARNLNTVVGTNGTINGDGTVTWAANGYIESATYTAPTTGMLYARMRVDSRDATDQRAFLSFGVTASQNVAYRSTGVADAQILLRAATPVYPSGHTPGNDNIPNIVGVWLSLAIRFNGANADAKESGGTIVSAMPDPGEPTKLRLASNHIDAQRGNVTIAEVIMYNAVHDDATMDSVLSYLDTL